jgi:hypothetical protein
VKPTIPELKSFLGRRRSETEPTIPDFNLKHLNIIIIFIIKIIINMKTMFKSSILLLLFSFSLLVFNLSCEKESIAQTTTPYTLPIATSTKLGGVIIGTGLNVTTEGVLSTQINPGILVFAKSGDKANEFWTSKYDGSGQVKITISSLPSTGEIIKANIKITPDGKKFFFVANPNPTNQNSLDALYSCNADGSGLTKLIDNIDEFSDLK